MAKAGLASTERSQEADKDPAASFRHKHLPRAIAPAQPFHSGISSQASSGHFQEGL